MPGGKGEQFEETPWTLVRALGTGGEHEARAAEEMARRYWRPVVAYIQAKARIREEEAQEIAQDFWAQVVFGRKLFHRADAGRGSLRALIRTAVHRFLIDRAKTAGEGRTTPLDLTETPVDGAAGSPEERFDREWAAAQLSEALRQAEIHYNEKGMDRHWQAFERYIVNPSIWGGRRPSTRELSEELGFATPRDLSSAVQVVKTKVVLLLKTQVATTVAPAEDAEAEFKHLLRLLQGLS